MLERILPLLPDGNRKFPLRYMRMVGTITDRMCLARNRYLLAHPIRTPGIELLRFLCLNLDIHQMDAYSNDADRYTNVIKYSAIPFRTVIDPIYTNSIAGGRWTVKNGTSTPCEILLNCEFANPINELPFDRDWGEWQRIRGVRLLYHDSLELPEDFAKSLFVFKEQKPNYLIFAINVPALLFKYYKYVVDCRKDQQIPDTNYFLKEFEYSYFFDDLYDIWTLNLLIRIFESPDSSVDDVINDITMPLRFCTYNMLSQGVQGIFEFVNLLRTGAIKPQDFLATHWFRGGKTIVDQYKENCIRFTQLPQNHRYLWLKTLNEFPYFFLINTLVNMFLDGPLKETVAIRCKEIFVTKIAPVNMPSAVINPVLGNFIRQWQSSLSQYLRGEPTIFPKPRKTT